MEDPWSLVKSKQYEKAIDEYSRLYKEDGQVLHLRNRGRVYLLVKDYLAALADFKQAIALTDSKYLPDIDYLYKGICFWCLNQPTQTVEAWRQSLSAPYTDAAGGVLPPALLLYASERLNHKHLEIEALDILRKHLQKHQQRAKGKPSRRKRTHQEFVCPGLLAWPGAIVPFLLGETGEEDLEQSVKSSSSLILKKRWRCQADFYIALRALREGNRSEFEVAMTNCASSQNGELEGEYFLALWELEQGFPEHPFT